MVIGGDALPSLRIIFCGTPAFAVPSLEHLAAQPDIEILSVVTQPDRPRGRGREISFSPVKERSAARGLPVFQPEKIRAADSEHFLRNAAPDAIVIIAYGQIIPARLLDIPRLGWINLHASLLPSYRGAAPIQWAVANGERVTGVTTMRIDAGLDTGDTLLAKQTEIGKKETAPELAVRLAELGAPLMAETLRGLRDGTLGAKPQDPSKATLTRPLKKDDGQIDWSLPAGAVYNRMRGFTPWPGAFTRFRGTTCHVAGEPLDSGTPRPAHPGTIHYDGRALLVSCGEQSFLRVSHVKMEGRKQVSAHEFANGARLLSGEQFA
jgi:methionyl-tRNA formyltransferase